MAVAIVGLGLLFFLGHALSWFFAKTKIPDLLILVGLGFLLGPVLGILSASDFGKVGSVLSTLALIVILYEGGLHLSARDLLTGSLPAAGLSILGFLLSVMIGIIVVYGLAAQSFSVALLVGVGIGSTSSAIVIPMVKYLSVKKETKTILSLESAFTDVLTIVTFLVLVDAIAAGKLEVSEILVGLGPNTLLAAVIGVFMAMTWAFINKKFENMMPNAFAGEAWALMTYGILELSGLNGAIGVLALGFSLANLELLPKWALSQIDNEAVSKFDLSLLKEITFLLRTVFFLYLGILIQLSDWKIILLSLIICAFIIVTRYIIVRIVLKPASFDRIDAIASTAMGPRGLACAVLATIPLQRGIEGGDFIQQLIFGVIPFSILFTSVFEALNERFEFRNRLASLYSKYPDQPNSAPQIDTVASSTET